ncbi:MAG: nitrate reductase cytochrome c-type subunit [Myxococcales bacterium]|nr:nitrate reductase cytochrome c-type subunit [Myxococcales bacterium]
MKDGRGLQIGLAVAIAVAGVGLVSGVESSGREVASYVEPGPPPPASAGEARGYRDLRARPHGPNAALPADWWRLLRGGGPDLFAEVAPTAVDRAQAVAARAARRAYDGAPPVIPHAVDQLAVPACLACHDQGLVVGGKVAPVMSHVERTSCLQCHVVAADPRPRAETPPPPESTFVGLGAPGLGERAWPGAPPTIPHATWMRERCESCHGPMGAHGLKTTHPWRQSCVQCHAPSAVLDQRPPAPVGAWGTP